MDDLIIDPSRAELKDATGIYVRAKRNEKWESVDIAELHKDSLMTFLKSRGGDNPLAEQTVLILLNHSR